MTAGGAGGTGATGNWGSWQVILSLAVGSVALIVFVVWEYFKRDEALHASYRSNLLRKDPGFIGDTGGLRRRIFRMCGLETGNSGKDSHGQARVISESALVI